MDDNVSSRETDLGHYIWQLVPHSKTSLFTPSQLSSVENAEAKNCAERKNQKSGEPSPHSLATF